MAPPRLEILHEDNHLLVVDKPTGLATQGVAEGAPSVLKLAKNYLKRKYKKPGNVYLGVVSRLDSTVGGVLAFARTSKAADRLTKQFQSGQVEKTYWALVEQTPMPAEGELSHWLLKNDRQRRMIVAPPQSRGAQSARLAYRVLRKEKKGTLVEVYLHTGRKHQIRVQLAAIHCPVVGDHKYGSRTPFLENAIALHCVRLGFEHPTTRERVVFTSRPPASWKLSGELPEPSPPGP